MGYGLAKASGLPYRPNVGAFLLNHYGLVWLGERADIPGKWQMPQGGVEPGETLEQAVLRELQEEIGLKPDRAKILRVSSTPHRYDFPDHVMQRMEVNNYRGQEQTWIALQLTGSDRDINIDSPEPDFRNWRWVTPKQLLQIVPAFKVDSYKGVIDEFADLL